MWMVFEVARPMLKLTCAKNSSGVPEALSTTSVKSREELEGRWPGVGMGRQCGPPPYTSRHSCSRTDAALFWTCIKIAKALRDFDGED